METLGTSTHKLVRPVLHGMIIGYLTFMLPMGVAYAFYAPARQAVASIMCGFAVVFALILALRVVPKYYAYSHSASRK